jgi:serine/threonine protein kinase
MGFDPTDFAFEYLLQNALKGRSSIGSKHYIMLPRTDPAFIIKFGEKGFAVIPYLPSDESHHEIEITLEKFLEFIPEDDIQASVFIGGTTDPSALPSDEDLVRMPVQDVRKLLNSAVAAIIPPNTTPQSDDIDKLEKFYREHLKAIHMAWLVQPDSDCNIVHGYKVVNFKGRGAFGQVYEVEQIDNHERAALKVLLPEVRFSRDYLNSFRRGVRSMRILTQRNVQKMVKFIDAYEVPACVLMEYIDGPTLTEAKEWGLLASLSQCLDVLTQIGEVVHNAHNLEERVLHRDLKPDNVILRDGFNLGDPLDVVVLDFDLSWHKGASELSVVHGARAQGYAAPEQTATGMKKGISTRHTAVDVFGYGMLAFFVFIGEDPRPNEQNFKDFEECLKEAIKNKFNPRWYSLPAFLSRTIVECTRDKQSDRISFASALEAFREAYKMTLSDMVAVSNPLILGEIAARVSPEGLIEKIDFGRHLNVRGLDPSKEIELKMESMHDNVVITVKLSKVLGTEGDPRANVVKYFKTAKDKSMSKLRGILTDVQGLITSDRLMVMGYLPIKESFSRNEITNICTILLDARTSLTLE